MTSSFNLLSHRDLGRARSYLRTAASAKSFQEVQSHFLEALPRLLPSESPCWDVWSADHSEVYELICPGDMTRAITPLVDSINATIPTHPVVVAGGWVSGEHSPALLSNYASSRQIRELPLYREVYRNIDIEHQIVASFGSLPDRNFIVSINRKTRDFSTAEFQLFDYVASGMERISLHLDRKFKLEKRLRLLAASLHQRSGIAGWRDLTIREIETLGRLATCRRVTDIAEADGVSRYTVAERLGSIRNKLGLETTRQLRAVLQETFCATDPSLDPTQNTCFVGSSPPKIEPTYGDT